MSSKKKEIVWHKKKEKFIASTLVKKNSVRDAPRINQDRRRSFARDLGAKIKKAVHQTDNSE